MGFPQGVTSSGRVRDVAAAQRTAGNVTLSGTVNQWQAVDTGLDLVMDAVAGDLLVVQATGTWGTQDFYGTLDFVIVVNGTLTTSLAAQAAYSTTASISLGGSPDVGEVDGGATPVRALNFSALGQRTLASGDIHNGTVTVRLMARTGSTTKTIKANGDPALQVFGQVFTA